MISLFTDDPDERWTADANAFADRADRALRPIVNDAIAGGFSLRDLAYVLDSTVLDLTLVALLTPVNQRRLME